MCVYKNIQELELLYNGFFKHEVNYFRTISKILDDIYFSMISKTRINALLIGSFPKYGSHFI